MLSRLSVRQKLSLLLMAPLTAVVLTIVPFTVERVDQSRAAAATAAHAEAARTVANLVQELQQERLLSLGYLVLPDLDRTAVVRQQVLVDDLVAGLRGPTPALVRPIAERGALLGSVRARVLDHAISAPSVYQTYTELALALLDALDLPASARADAVGGYQLQTFDALLRTDEYASGVAAALLCGTADAGAARGLLATAVTSKQLELARFHELATTGQRALVDRIDAGTAGAATAQLVAQVSGGIVAVAPPLTVLTVATTEGVLRHTVEDRVASDLAAQADQRVTASRTVAGTVAIAGLLVLILVVVLSVRVSQAIAVPLRRLTRAAGAVADLTGAELVRVADSDRADADPPRLGAVQVAGQDEIGELAAAFNRVQATAALLLERQVSTRRNVAVMFANVGRRTQSLVGRQLALIDDMERGEQDPQTLARLYRLDHLTTRLRRSADSLLVVSGTYDESLSSPTPLVDVIRAAMAEIEGFQAVTLGQIPDVTVDLSLAADLRLLLAELLENATSFSPPGVAVTISAETAGDTVISIVDHGIGMTAAKLTEENLRLVERQRLDLAPTQVLGLFVVGRLARRHALSVRLEPTEQRGVTVRIQVPGWLCPPATGTPRPVPVIPAQRRPAEPAGHVRAGHVRADHVRADHVPADHVPADVLRALAAAVPALEGFAWFGGPAVPAPHAPAPAGVPGVPAGVPGVPAGVLGVPAALPVPADATIELPAIRTHSGLTRRRPGRTLSEFDPVTDAGHDPARLRPRDAAAERAELEAFTAGQARARLSTSDTPTVVPDPAARHSGLTRRVPGASITDPIPASTPGSTPVRLRDALAERAELDSFVDGVTRAAHEPPEPSP